MNNIRNKIYLDNIEVYIQNFFYFPSISNLIKVVLYIRTVKFSIFSKNHRV